MILFKLSKFKLLEQPCTNTSTYSVGPFFAIFIRLIRVVRPCLHMVLAIIHPSSPTLPPYPPYSPPHCLRLRERTCTIIYMYKFRELLYFEWMNEPPNATYPSWLNCFFSHEKKNEEEYSVCLFIFMYVYLRFP